MAVHNGENYVADAIKSVLNQSLADFELVIVDDASSDGTPDILSSFEDRRFHIIRNGENLGLTKSLNIGLGKCHGRYIARLDADDRCLADRLQVQVDVFQQNPKMILVASSYYRTNERGRVRKAKIKPLDDIRLRWASQFGVSVDHPTAMFRRDLTVDRGLMYDERFVTAQDYDYWLRLLDSGEGCVLSVPLLLYRAHEESISVTRRREQAANIRQIALENLDMRWPELAEHRKEIETLLDFRYLWTPATPAGARQAIDGLTAFVDAFCARYGAQPEERRWIIGYAAGVLADSVLRRGGGFTRPATLVTFCSMGRNYLIPLFERVLEVSFAR